MPRTTHSLLRWLDPLFALSLAAALVMVVVTAWPQAPAPADPGRSRAVCAADQVGGQGPGDAPAPTSPRC